MGLHGIKLIEAYKDHPEQFYPLNYQTKQMPERNEYDEYNLGWYAGMVDDKRPFFAECWAWEGFTMITISVSVKDIEDMTAEELDKLFQDADYYKQKEPGKNLPKTDKYVAKDGNEYYVLNLTVGAPEEPARIYGGWTNPWSDLNDYNLKTQK